MPQVGIIMGSTSDLPIMQEAIDILAGFDIETEVDIVSATEHQRSYLNIVKLLMKEGLK